MSNNPSVIPTILGLRGKVTATSWQPPESMSEQEWQAAGEVLGQADRGVQWWLGDWWRFGERRFGATKAIIEAGSWRGPDYQTCANAGWVSKTFETISRRRELVPFSHHMEVAALPPDRG